MQRTPGQRAGLTREQVLAAAAGLLAEDGLDGLTMRALARRLEVAPNALYSHVAGKTALVDDLLDEVLGEVRTPERGDPVEGLHALMTSTYDVLLAHRDLVPVYLARQGARGPHAQHLGEVVLGLLADAGVHGDAAGEALRVLIVHTLGFAAFGGADGPTDAQRLRANHASGLRWLLTGIVSPP